MKQAIVRKVSTNCRTYTHRNGMTIKHFGLPAISEKGHQEGNTAVSLQAMITEQREATYASMMRNREAQ